MAKAVKQATKKRARVDVMTRSPNSWDWVAVISLNGGPYSREMNNIEPYGQRKDAKQGAERTMALLGIEIVEMNSM